MHLNCKKQSKLEKSTRQQRYKMKFRTLLYFLSLMCLLVYATAYSFDYINADLSYPGGKNDGLSLVGMIVFFPLYGEHPRFCVTAI